MNVPMDFVLRQMGQNNAKLSYVERLMRGNVDAEGEADIEQSTAALYAGGADSTAAALSFFFLAMTTFPEVQKRACEEIDLVVGHKRLPDFLDRERVPYIEAIIKETLCWHPFAPICPPHMCDAEDEFRGYRIPKGAMILPSIKWFSMDSAVYTEPELFQPERFLGLNTQTDPSRYAFGFGRRICPGRLLADANLFLVIAHSLAVF
jgi:cytochrome P450